MSFNEKVKLHLAAYKKIYYPSFGHGIWRPKSVNKILNYAFTKADRNYNLIETYRNGFIKCNGKRHVKYHMYFHHMNSSQAMCINFFFPLEKEGKLEFITDCLGFPDERIIYSTAEFEKLSDIDSKKRHRPTNFDYYFKTESGKEFFFEIKYTEQAFGKAKNDGAHKDKYDDVYQSELNVVSAKYSNPEDFFDNYQIMRNLIHIGKNKYVVFVYPKENKGINRAAVKAKKDILAPAYRQHLFNMYWEDLYNCCSSKIESKALKEQMKEFGEKYFLKTNY